MTRRPQKKRGGADPLLAAELALGLLEGEERREAERLAATDPAFAAELAAWQENLARFAEAVPEVAPDPAVHARLRARLFGEPAPRSRHRLGRWPWLLAGAGIGGLALAAGFALALLVSPLWRAPVAAPGFVAEIAADDETLRLLLVYDRASGALRYARTAGSAAPGRSLQLWAIAGDGPPVPIAVLPAAERGAVPFPADLAGADGLVIAVSDEPPGGSPIGRPTGPVLAAGPAQEL